MSNKNVKVTFNWDAFDEVVSKSLDEKIKNINECPKCESELEIKDSKKYCAQCNNFINFVKPEKYNR